MKAAIELTKKNSESIYWSPLEQGSITITAPGAARVTVRDGECRQYVDRKVTSGGTVRFSVRGSAGRHTVHVRDSKDKVLAYTAFRLKPATKLSCNKGPYTEIAERIKRFLEKYAGVRPLIINDRLYRMLVTWGRDHVHTLKAQKYFLEDVKSGMDYWMDTQEPNGMVWDCIHPNPDYPARTWFGEALGKGYFRYEDNMRYIVRRIPVEADCEFLYTEGVWYAWKASGDDAWMAKQLPRLEKALKYNSSNPVRWSKKHGLVRRSFCMDSWDFANPHYCNGDHRRINPGDPQFLFHSDNSGLYSIYWRMAEMYEAVGNAKRARELRREGEAFRKRANKKLFFGNVYGHMIPETLPEKGVYALVGDERKRMSLSTGYTINRKLPTHSMAVKVLKEYQRRGKAKKNESFAEWWTMDPPYTKDQWPSAGPPWGEYMNGAICTIIAGEIAKAAFDHGMEDYGADIIERVWKLSERDGGELHQVYRRLPENPTFPKARFEPVDMRSVVNRTWKHKAYKGIEAWTGEGVNDMRNIPTGKQKFGLIEFDVVDPAKNNGYSVLRISPDGEIAPKSVTIPVNGLRGESIYFMHTTAFSVPRNTVNGAYDVLYADGTSERIWIRMNQEIGPWWGITDAPDLRRGNNQVNRNAMRVAWRGANPQWSNVGMHMFGWNNPHPDKTITAIRVEAIEVPGKTAGIMLGAVSLSDRKVQYDEPIRSYGLPDCWAQAAVYYAVAEGLAGIEDTGKAFDKVKVAPRWTSSRATKADITLHYPASDGYCSYRYGLDRKKRKISLDLTGSFREGLVQCLLPGKAAAKKVVVDGKEIPFKTMTIEGSVYADFVLHELPKSAIQISY